MQSRFYTFIDYYQNTVQLSFEENFFSREPKHVWVICQYDGQWLLTQHKDRGLEFPGGKVEEGEMPQQAAIREVYEETGGVVTSLVNLGQYKVSAKQDVVIKNVYYAEIERLEIRDHYFETNGPKLVLSFPEDIRTNKEFSFIMKDQVLSYCLKKLRKELG